MTDTVSVISVPGRLEFNVCRSISDYQTEANIVHFVCSSEFVRYDCESSGFVPIPLLFVVVAAVCIIFA